DTESALCRRQGADSVSSDPTYKIRRGRVDWSLKEKAREPSPLPSVYPPLFCRMPDSGCYAALHHN
ncbi:hypothetical protein ACC810_38815, partial [Rhizobium ruizarguesonis]